jgi:hypothetical protein
MVAEHAVTDCWENRLLHRAAFTGPRAGCRWADPAMEIIIQFSYDYPPTTQYCDVH